MPGLPQTYQKDFPQYQKTMNREWVKAIEAAQRKVHRGDPTNTYATSIDPVIRNMRRYRNATQPQIQTVQNALYRNAITMATHYPEKFTMTTKQWRGAPLAPESMAFTGEYYPGRVDNDDVRPQRSKADVPPRIEQLDKAMGVSHRVRADERQLGTFYTDDPHESNADYAHSRLGTSRRRERSASGAPQPPAQLRMLRLPPDVVQRAAPAAAAVAAAIPAPVRQPLAPRAEYSLGDPIVAEREQRNTAQLIDQASSEARAAAELSASQRGRLENPGQASIYAAMVQAPEPPPAPPTRRRIQLEPIRLGSMANPLPPGTEVASNPYEDVLGRTRYHRQFELPGERFMSDQSGIETERDPRVTYHALQEERQRAAEMGLDPNGDDEPPPLLNENEESNADVIPTFAPVASAEAAAPTIDQPQLDESTVPMGMFQSQEDSLLPSQMTSSAPRQSKAAKRKARTRERNNSQMALQRSTQSGSDSASSTYGMGFLGGNYHKMMRFPIRTSSTRRYFHIA